MKSTSDPPFGDWITILSPTAWETFSALLSATEDTKELLFVWGAQNGLSFCPDKTTVVFFTRKYNFHKKVLPKVKKI